MKEKIIGIFVCMLLIATAVPAVTSVKNNAINATILNTLLPNIKGGWVQKQKLHASDASSYDYFLGGDLEGNTALIGAPQSSDQGAVYYFTYNGTTWTQQQKLLASDGQTGDFFGVWVDVEGDTALIGAAGDDGVKGSAYVFTRSGNTWTQQAKLTASDGAAGDNFGWPVSLSGDTALLGAFYDDDNGVDSGSAYVFTRSGTAWTQQAKLLASDGMANDIFGHGVSLYGDTALIGAQNNNNYKGAAYVFTRSDTTWTQQTKLVISNGTTLDQFGSYVCLKGDTALIGAGGYDGGKGTVYVFTVNGTTWTQEQQLLASDGQAGDWFSWPLTFDGDTALIGAYLDDDNGVDSGSAYIFTRVGTTWTQQQKLLAPDGARDDWFSCRVALDGDTALIGAPDDDDYGTDSGSAYVFVRTSENQPPVADFTWIPQNPKPKQPIVFDASASHDSDGTITLYEWDWNNDGTFDESHTSPTATHTWDAAGNYKVTLRVTDNNSATGTITKTVYVNDTIDFTIKITGGFGIKANIANNGSITATQLKWTFTLTKGFILLGKTKSGNIVSLAAGASRTVKDSPIIGFGKTIIRVNVTCAEGYSGTQSVIGSMFLFFVFGIQES
jgi:hypothetical protein